MALDSEFGYKASFRNPLLIQNDRNLHTDMRDIIWIKIM